MARRGLRPAERSAASTPTRSTWCRRFSTPLVLNRRAPCVESPKRRSRGSASPVPSTLRMRRPVTRTQYFEVFGHRAIYHDGWRAVCPWPGPNFTEATAMGRRLGDPITPEILEQLDANGWELYDINEDPTESANVAAEHPDQLRALIALWWEEAEKYKVLPLDGSMQARLGTERPQTSSPRTRFLYRPHTSLVPVFGGRHPSITDPTPSKPTSKFRPRAPAASSSRRAEMPEATAFSWTMAACATCTTTSDANKFEVDSPEQIPPGRHTLRYEFEPTGQPDFKVGKGRPAVPSCTSTASSSGTQTSPTPRRSSSSSRASAVATTLAPRPAKVISRRSRSLGRSIRSPWKFRVR